MLPGGNPMNTHRHSRLVMFGAAPETRGSIAAVVECYRAHGLFKHWPIEYLATHGGGGAVRSGALALDALRRFALVLASHGRVPVHLHLSGRAAPRRDAAFIAAALAARCPLIVQLHGGGFEQGHGNRLEALLFEQAACVIVACESVRAWVRSVARNAHVICLPPPVAGAEAPPPMAGRPDLVLFLGRLDPAKGIVDLLEAVAGLRASVPEVRLVCAGDGDRIGVARAADSLGIADAVKFTGWVGPSGKRALLEAAAVVALPSYREGLPLSLLEAMAAGVPVVASAVGGVPEALVDGVGGYLIAPGDKASLERHLRRLLLDRELGARLGSAARESARVRFAPERALARLDEIYAGVGLAQLGAAPRPPLADLRKAA
jgi:glycosyltransferase involved in cell wall biosynthesis